MDELIQNCITGSTAVKISASIEAAARGEHLAPGQRLPTVRRLAQHLKVSPGTVAAAYQSLQRRGVVMSDGRRGTRVCHRPLHPVRWREQDRSGLRRLDDGNPDASLLPAFDSILASLNATPRLYGTSPFNADLVAIVRSRFDTLGVAPSPIAIVNGAMDAIDRVLDGALKAGDAIAVEDPGFAGHHDLAAARGLSLIPLPMDDEGPVPDGLAQALSMGVRAVIFTPRAQSPTGCFITARRVDALQRVLAAHPDCLTIEDDHMAPIVLAPFTPIHTAKTSRWVYIQSYSKSLNPDLRLAAVAGDAATMTHLQDRMELGERWVSHILQTLTHALLTSSNVADQLDRAAAVYTERRDRLVDGLREVGFDARGASGFNVWVPVREETAVVQSIAASGWAVRAGEGFRLTSSPGIRITAATLESDEATTLVGAFADLPRGVDQVARSR